VKSRGWWISARNKIPARNKTAAGPRYNVAIMNTATPAHPPGDCPILDACLEEFHKLKQMAERAMAQLDDGDFHFRLHDDANSIGVIVKHLAGNMRSRFGDFLTSDGEKPDRHRDNEFIEEQAPRDEIMRRWEAGWAIVFAALKPLKDSDLSRVVTVRGEPHSVFKAINRQTSHYAYHVGQIVLLARHIKGANWKYLTIPRGQSEQFTKALREKMGPK
jgi:hypothetical protein